MQKTFIRPHLRRLRLKRGEDASAMARALGLSPAYVNLLENNQRSVPGAVMLRLFEACGVAWRDSAENVRACPRLGVHTSFQRGFHTPAPTAASGGFTPPHPLPQAGVSYPRTH